jgi:hypothetical protein
MGVNAPFRAIAQSKIEYTQRRLFAHWSHSLSVANVPKADLGTKKNMFIYMAWYDHEISNLN